MDLDTFFTKLYAYIEDWYTGHPEYQRQRQSGPAPRLSDSEVLTIAIAGQWRVGVPWQSERGLVRWMQKYGRGWFPQMLGRSQFNERVRGLWGVFIKLQQAVAEALSEPTEAYVAVDCLPLPAYSGGQALKEAGHWLWDSTVGRGGTNGQFFYGDHLLVAVGPGYTVDGWLVGRAGVQDRWLLEAFLSTRAGCPGFQGPAPDSGHRRAERALPPPSAQVGCLLAVGQDTQRPYLADRAFNGQRWQTHWLNTYQACVISLPPANAPEASAWSVLAKRSLASRRQVVETVFARLTDVFGLKRLQAHSRWGQYTRLAAKMAAYHLGMWLNQGLGRPRGALGTLIC